MTPPETCQGCGSYALMMVMVLIGLFVVCLPVAFMCVVLFILGLFLECVKRCEPCLLERKIMKRSLKDIFSDVKTIVFADESEEFISIGSADGGPAEDDPEAQAVKSM